MKEQALFRCTIMRGGTSKAVFMKKNELPEDAVLRDKIILAIFGSPDVRQIDGLGGSDITTSKVAIIGPPTREDADIDYNFGQVSLTEANVAWNSNCGNISSAVGPYAIDEGMVRVTEPETTVRIHNTNTGKILVAKVPVREGMAAVDGEYALDGVPGTGARIALDYSLTWGAGTGKLLPTGKVTDIFRVDGLGDVPVSIVDIANPVCFVEAKRLGITGKEARPHILADPVLMERLERIRSLAAVACSFCDNPDVAARVSPLIPQVSFVSPPRDYEDYATGEPVRAADVDFLARVLFNQLPTDTFTGTGTICAAVASRIEGTVVNRVCSPEAGKTGLVRLGHARGINRVEVAVEKTLDGFVVQKAAFGRTARRILDGYVYVKKSALV